MIGRALALAGVLCAAVPAAAQQAVTKAEVRRQKPSVTDAQLRDQLWGMFRKEDRRSKKAPSRMLGTVWLETPAYPTKVPDLCRSDLVTMQLAPTGGSGVADAETPMRAYGLDSVRRFLFLKLPPEKAPEEWPEVRRDIWHGACARLDKDDDRFFRAKDEDMAEQGYRALLRAARAVQAEEVKPACDLGRVDTRPCAEALATFATLPISIVDECPAVEGVTCYSIDGSGDLQVRISIVTEPDRYKSPDGRHWPQDALLGVDFSLQIILWHEIPD